jgi:DNA-binding transcriptional MerR regulator/methylmalonyl-CoA mutase cobalamin-binding subunit
MVEAMGLTIKAVAERTGVSVHTLRAWERRYGVPSPRRGAENRYRLYTEQDLADVLFMKEQVAKGIAPAQASVLLRQQQPHALIASVAPSQPIADMQIGLLEAFAQSNEAVARHLLDQAFGLFAPEIIALQIIAPTMYEIGRRWMSGEMTVWQEHLASNIVQEKLFAVLHAQPPLAPSAPEIVVACAPQEEHQLGLIIFALIARRQGWRIAYLGQSTPLADIIGLAHTVKPKAITISITTVRGLAGVMRWLNAAERPSTPIVFGGRLPNVLPDLRTHLPGNYLGDDVLTVVQNLKALKPWPEYWSPSKKVWNLANVLQTRRLEIAGITATEFMAHAPAQRHWDLTSINDSTLFLLDALACALAFNVPALIDHEREWLAEVMPPRAVKPELILKYLDVFKMILKKHLTVDQRRLIDPLIERMQIHT